MKRLTSRARMKQILDILASKGEADVYDLAITANLSITSVYNYLRLLERMNLIERTESGTWKIKEKEKQTTELEQ